MVLTSTTSIIDRIKKKTISATDLTYIANNFTIICDNIIVDNDSNYVFRLMTEKYLPNILINILNSRYINSTYGYNLIHFYKYCKKYFQVYDIHTFCNNINKISSFYQNSYRLNNIFKFINNLNYDILNNYNITINDTILDKYMLYFAKSLPANIVSHYIILYKSRFLDQYVDGAQQSFYSSEKDYKNNVPYVDLYGKRNGQILFDDALKLINVAIKKNYYDIFIDCYNIGVILNESHFIEHISSFTNKYKDYLLNEPYKILKHFCEIEKFQLTLDLSLSNELQNDLSNILPLVNNITFDQIKKLYEADHYIDVNTFGYTDDQLDILYNILFVRCIFGKNVVYLFANNIGKKKYIFREMFKCSTISKIKQYQKLYKLDIDQWCIDNAFICNNKNVLKVLMNKNIYPSNNVRLLLYGTKIKKDIEEYLNNNIKKSYNFANYGTDVYIL